MNQSMVGGFIVPGKPHILLAPNKNPGWQSLYNSFALVREAIRDLNPDLLLVYSSQWVSIIGHQIQADPTPEWKFVDEDFHELGTIHYKFRIDEPYSHAYKVAAKGKGLTASTTAYRGFPIDAGTVTALKLLNPDNEFPASVVSCNMYADRDETILLGQAAREAAQREKKRVVAIAVTSLSNRMWTQWIDPADDCIHSEEDDRWNKKLLQLLRDGKFEDVSQQAQDISRHSHGDSQYKALWWLGACLQQNSSLGSKIYDYQPVWGSGAAIVGLAPQG